MQGADERECRVTNADEAESSRRPVDRSIDLVQGNVVHKATNTSVLSLTDPPTSPFPPFKKLERYQQGDKLQVAVRALSRPRNLCGNLKRRVAEGICKARAVRRREAGSGGSVAAEFCTATGPVDAEYY
jgi:hypothetical protein